MDFPFNVNINGEDSPDMVPALPAMSATNAHENGRMDRLASAFGYACAAVRQMSHRYQRAWADGAVIALHDHKGCLEVTWRDQASRIMFEGVVMGAWEAHAEHEGLHKLAK